MCSNFHGLCTPAIFFHFSLSLFSFLLSLFTFVFLFLSLFASFFPFLFAFLFPFCFIFLFCFLFFFLFLSFFFGQQFSKYKKQTASGMDVIVFDIITGIAIGLPLQSV